jgi:hypothetical protein
MGYFFHNDTFFAKALQATMSSPLITIIVHSAVLINTTMGIVKEMDDLRSGLTSQKLTLNP